MLIIIDADYADFIDVTMRRQNIRMDGWIGE